MSLIEEALRRQQEDAGKPSAAPASQPAPSGQQGAKPPPADEAPAESPAEPEEQPKSRNWPLIAAIVILLLVLAGAAVWVSLLLFKQMTRTKAAPAPRTQVAAATETPDAATHGVTGGPPAEADAQRTSSVASNEAAVPPSARRVQDTADAGAPAPPEAEEPSAGTGAVAVVKESVPWPRIYLSGILKRGAGAGSAYLNNKIIAEKDSIDGVMLVSVAADGVELEYKGERRHLRLYGTTE